MLLSIQSGQPASSGLPAFPMTIEAILKEYHHQLKRFIKRRVANEADAQDLLQDIYMKTLRHFKGIREPAKLRGWLFKTARTSIIDYYRKKGKNFERQAALWYDDINDEPDTLQRQLAGCLKPFFRSLPPEYRRVLEEVDLYGQPQEQLAKRLGVSYSGLKSRVQRGRSLLLKLFKQCCAFETDAGGRVIDFIPKDKTCRRCA